MNLDLLNTYEFWIMLLLIGVAGYLYHGIRALAVGLDEISKSVRVMEQRQKRLSATYMKIETDLLVIGEILVSQGTDQKSRDEILAIFEKGRNWFAEKIESGPALSEVLRGLEFPDEDSDPWFWQEDRVELIAGRNAPKRDTP